MTNVFLKFFFQELFINEEISYSRNENIAIYLGDNGSFDLQDFNKVGNEKHLLDKRYYFTGREGKDNCELLGEIHAKITVVNA